MNPGQPAAAVQTLRSRDNPLLVRLRRLARDPAAYRRLGEIWLEGDHLCSACLARGHPVALAVIAEAAWEGDAALRALALRAPRVVVVPQPLLAAASTLESPAAMGFVVPWQGVRAVPAPGGPGLVLDRLQDAGNVGSILRSAAALGVRQVVALKGTVALWSPKVLRAGMGAHFGLTLLEGLLPGQLAEAVGVPLVATALETDALLTRAELPEPCAWVLGHEGRGVADEVRAQCALSVRIPQPGGEESLNVAAAAAICLYESLRRRG